MLNASQYAPRGKSAAQSAYGAEWCPSRADLWNVPVAFNPAAPTKGSAFDVFANEGRWIVACPCGGAQLAALDDPRFMCVDCGNGDNGGAWHPVTWPPNRDAIARALSVRLPVNQNWFPGETVDLLILENIANGVSQ